MGNVLRVSQLHPPLFPPRRDFSPFYRFFLEFRTDGRRWHALLPPEMMKLSARRRVLRASRPPRPLSSSLLRVPKRFLNKVPIMKTWNGSRLVNLHRPPPSRFFVLRCFFVPPAVSLGRSEGRMTQGTPSVGTFEPPHDSPVFPLSPLSSALYYDFVSTQVELIWVDKRLTCARRTKPLPRNVLSASFILRAFRTPLKVPLFFLRPFPTPPP